MAGKRSNPGDNIRSSYMFDVLNTPTTKRMVRDIIRVIKESGVKFDSIACRGMSGLIVASPVSLRLHKPLVIVRKPERKCHTSMLVEGHMPEKMKYIIIDDFISTGETIKAIVQEIGKYYEERSRGTARLWKAQCNGVFLYKPGFAVGTGDWFKFKEQYIHGPILSTEAATIWPQLKT